MLNIERPMLLTRKIVIVAGAAKLIAFRKVAEGSQPVP